jgi:hypothetical protein
MNADLDRKQSLFDAARDLTDLAEQRAFLEAGCGGDLVLLAKIERLLSADEPAEKFFADCIPTLATISAALEYGGTHPPADQRRVAVGGIGPSRLSASRKGSSL